MVTFNSFPLEFPNDVDFQTPIEGGTSVRFSSCNYYISEEERSPWEMLCARFYLRGGTFDKFTRARCSSDNLVISMKTRTVKKTMLHFRRVLARMYK